MVKMEWHALFADLWVVLLGLAAGSGGGGGGGGGGGEGGLDVDGTCGEQTLQRMFTTRNRSLRWQHECKRDPVVEQEGKHVPRATVNRGLGLATLCTTIKFFDTTCTHTHVRHYSKSQLCSLLVYGGLIC